MFFFYFRKVIALIYISNTMAWVIFFFPNDSRQLGCVVYRLKKFMFFYLYYSGNSLSFFLFRFHSIFLSLSLPAFLVAPYDWRRLGEPSRIVRNLRAISLNYWKREEPIVFARFILYLGYTTFLCAFRLKSRLACLCVHLQVSIHFSNKAHSKKNLKALAKARKNKTNRA